MTRVGVGFRVICAIDGESNEKDRPNNAGTTLIDKTGGGWTEQILPVPKIARGAGGGHDDKGYGRVIGRVMEGGGVGASDKLKRESLRRQLSQYVASDLGFSRRSGVSQTRRAVRFPVRLAGTVR